MKLFYQTYFDSVESSSSEDLSAVLIIPGLFGSTANWRGFAKQLAKHRRVIVIDQRNHGQSPHADANSYLDLVADIVELLDDLGIHKITLCGHSMGGKTAMTFALTQPQRLDQLIVLDIAPVAYDHSHAPILEALQNTDLSEFTSRSEVEQALSQKISDKSTRLFIMLSLTGRAGEFAWRLNVDALLANLPAISGFPNHVSEGTPFAKECLFVKGGQSEYVNQRHYESIYQLFPSAIISTVERAGHWLHIEQQQAVLENVLNFLKKE